LLEPAGTAMVNLMSLPVLAARPVTATPLVRVPPVGGGGVVPPPSAASTAALASTIPVPQPPEQAPGNGRVVLLRMLSTCAGVLAATAMISAATPATCGEDIEVPLSSE
jgi:hypothetical protein